MVATTATGQGDGFSRLLGRRRGSGRPQLPDPILDDDSGLLITFPDRLPDEGRRMRPGEPRAFRCEAQGDAPPLRRQGLDEARDRLASLAGVRSDHICTGDPPALYLARPGALVEADAQSVAAVLTACLRSRGRAFVPDEGFPGPLVSWAEAIGTHYPEEEGWGGPQGKRVVPAPGGAPR